MIDIINKKYCNNDSINELESINKSYMIIDDKEIYFLKDNNNVLINKNNEILNKYINFVYDYDKLYLNYSGNINDYEINEKYYFKNNNVSYLYYNVLSDIEVNDRLDKIILTRNQLEENFNSNNYDSMYIVNLYGNIIYAKNNVDGIVVDNTLIPEDNYLLELREKMQNKNDNIFLYDSSFTGRYLFTLITSKNNIFNMAYFKIMYTKDNNFVLIQAPVRIDEPKKEIEKSLVLKKYYL